jgi:tRNA A-37 threonylcarbamoyl transferase component Bud32
MPNQWLLRIARAGRARREGEGILAFAERGLPAPRLLLWGETRSWGPRQLGIVSTVRIDAPTVAASYARSPDAALLDAALDELSRIHRAGLAHGDPWLRNFLDTRPRPTAFDLPSWAPLRPPSQAEDLARFLASTIKLAGGDREARRLLERYRGSGLGLPRPADRILRRARAYAREKERP